MVDIEPTSAHILHPRKRGVDPRLDQLEILGPLVTRPIPTWNVGPNHDETAVVRCQVRPWIRTFGVAAHAVQIDDGMHIFPSGVGDAKRPVAVNVELVRLTKAQIRWEWSVREQRLGFSSWCCCGALNEYRMFYSQRVYG